MNSVRIIFALLLYTPSAFGQIDPNSLAEIVRRIKLINEVQHERVGFAGVESENYKNYLALRKKASISELVDLTDDANSTVACYASWALVDKSFNNLPSILNYYLNNDRFVSTFSGCIKSSDRLSSEFYHRYWNNFQERSAAKDKTLFTMDSLILYNDKSDWLLLVRALENRVYPNSFNKRIEYLAFTKGNKDAITYLQNLHEKTYDNQIKKALLKYLQRTNFSNEGVTPYFETVRDLLSYKDDNINNTVIAKLKKDRHWEYDKEKFSTLFKKYNIQLPDHK